MPGNVSSSECSSSSRNTWVPGSRPSSGIGGARRDVDEPGERQRDADHDAGEHARGEHADDGGDRDPEVESRDPVETAQLGDVDHPEHDGVDDHRRRAPPWEGARTPAPGRSSVNITSPPVMSDASGVRAPADSFSELAERLVETGIPWNTPAPTFAIPCATDS